MWDIPQTCHGRVWLQFSQVPKILIKVWLGKNGLSRSFTKQQSDINHLAKAVYRRVNDSGDIYIHTYMRVWFLQFVPCVMYAFRTYIKQLYVNMQLQVNSCFGSILHDSRFRKYACPISGFVLFMLESAVFNCNIGVWNMFAYDKSLWHLYKRQ